MPRLRDSLHFLVLALGVTALYAAGPALFLFVITRPPPSIADQLARIGHDPAALADEGDDAPVEYTVDLPFRLVTPPEPPAAEVVEAPPAPAPRAPAPAAAPAGSGPAPDLAVAVAEDAPGRVVAEGGRGDGGSPWDGPVSAGRTPRPPKGKKKSCDKPHPNVRIGADGVVEIDRSLVDHYTADLESFMSLGYSRPYDEGGVHGWWISGFSCASPVAKAGFQRGDVLLSVNGKKTRSWVGVYLLYQKLKNKDEFVVELVRKGEPVTLRFRVVPG